MPLLPISLGLILGILFSFISGGNPEFAGLTITSVFILGLLGLLFGHLFKTGSFLKSIPIAAFSFFFMLMGFCNLELAKKVLLGRKNFQTR